MLYPGAWKTNSVSLRVMRMISTLSAYTRMSVAKVIATIARLRESWCRNLTLTSIQLTAVA